MILTQEHQEQMVNSYLKTHTVTEIKTENKTISKRLSKHRAELDKMKYESYINFYRSYKLNK